MKRIVALFMAVLILWGCLGSAFAEKREVETAFYDKTIVDGDVSVYMEMDTAWFSRPSSVYDHNLAKLSFILAAAAFKKQPSMMNENDEALKGFFEMAGFGTYEVHDYHVVPTKDTIANGFAARELSDEQGPFVLVAVPVCGQGYKDEWVSNFTVGNTPDHSGFSDAAAKVYERLMTYLDMHFPGKRIKLWIAGFSRAAAVSNELGHMALTSGRFEENNVFCYCFATPNNTKQPVAHPQIFNILNGFDGVPKVPFADWGYGKHGVMMYLPTPSTTVDYDEKEKKANVIYRAATDIEDGRVVLFERNVMLAQLLLVIYNIFPYSEAYVAGYQEALSRAWLAPGSVAEKLTAFIEAAEELGCTLELSEEGEAEVGDTTRKFFDYVARAVIHEQEDPVWSNVLTSGKGLVHEHFPVTYLSWLFADIPAEELYDNASGYTTLTYALGPSLKVVHKDKTTGKETVLHDDAKGIRMTAYTETEGRGCLDLARGETYELTLSFPQEAENRITTYVMDMANVSGVFKCTKRMHLFAGETVTIRVGADPLAFNGILVLLNGKVPVKHVLSELVGDYGEEDEEGTRPLDELLFEVFAALPILFMAMVTVIAAFVSLIVRIIRRRRDIGLPCKKPLKTLLIGFAAVWTAAGIYCIVMLLELSGNSGNVTSKLFVRLGELYKTTGTAIIGIVAFFQLLTAGLCLGAIRRRGSRRWLVFLCLTNLFCGVFMVALAGTTKLASILLTAYQLLPVATASVTLIIQRGDAKARKLLAAQAAEAEREPV